jgi:preprotein translocase subunit YajC
VEPPTPMPPEILLMQAAPESGFPLQLVLMMGGLMLLMYALMIRPQQRQEKERKAMLAQVDKGDQIVTTGGIHGRVIGSADDILTVEIAERVRIKLSRSAVQTRLPGKAPKNGDKE